MNLPQLDQYLRPIGSPITTEGKMSGVEFSRKFNVQTTRAKVSSIGVQNFIQETGTDTATSSFTTGQSLLVTATLDPEQLYSTAKPFGIPQISVYQGSSADDTMQIYPRSGSSITPGNYIFDFGFDWGSANSDGTNVVAMLAIENIAAGAVDILVKIKWKYIANRDGSFVPS